MLLSTIHLKELRNTQDFLNKKTTDTKLTPTHKRLPAVFTQHLDPKKEKRHTNATHIITQTGTLNSLAKEKAATKTQITITRKTVNTQTEKS